jgi:hypothetical protein
MGMGWEYNEFGTLPVRRKIKGVHLEEGILWKN